MKWSLGGLLGGLLPSASQKNNKLSTTSNLTFIKKQNFKKGRTQKPQTEGDQ